MPRYPEWLRYPMVSPDGNQIAFVYKGDIYTVGVDGGDAKRLTFQSKMDLQPIWSPDGIELLLLRKDMETLMYYHGRAWRRGHSLVLSFEQ